MRFLQLLFTTILLVSGISTTLAAPSVEFELITEPGFPATGKQRWLRMLSEVGADGLTIREGRSGDKGGITNRGTESAPQYHVFGILTKRSMLKLPGGGQYRISDAAAIKKWIAKLKSDGMEGLYAKPGAFGLTSKQLVEVHEKLSRPVSKSTKGKIAAEVATSIIQSLTMKLALDPDAKQALGGDETVAEELQGLSQGTALAAVLRPLGLVLVPQRPSGSETFLVITQARKAQEVWPVGWALEKAPADSFPKLFDFLTVEIDDFALDEALDSIEKRLEAPFLYNHNSLARHNVEMGQLKVSLPKMRTFYKKIIDRLLMQSRPRLTSEVRVDEAGKPFLWITTLTP